MISETSAVQSDRAEFQALVRHLAHELRQPLSCMESIAYYLEMVLPPTDEKVWNQVENLRSMVQQASWILEDVVHAVKTTPPNPSSLRLDHFVARVTSEIQLREEQHLHVHLTAPGVTIACDSSQVEYLITTLLDFFRHVVRVSEPISVSTGSSGEFASITIDTCSAQGDVTSLSRLLDPQPYGSVRTLTEANGGSLRIEVNPPHGLKVSLLFPAQPAAPQSLNP